MNLLRTRRDLDPRIGRWLTWILGLRATRAEKLLRSLVFGGVAVVLFLHFSHGALRRAPYCSGAPIGTTIAMTQTSHLSAARREIPRYLRAHPALRSIALCDEHTRRVVATFLNPTTRQNLSEPDAEALRALLKAGSKP